MERDVYARMAEIEAHHWWFVARRAILAEVLLRLVDLSPRRAFSRRVAEPEATS